MQYTKEQLAKFMDHTLLKADATGEQLEKLCLEAREYGTFSVCINPCNLKRAGELLEGSGVKRCTVVGFPLGQMTSEAKAFETSEAVFNGADEIDMVINVGRVKDGDFDYVREDIQAVVNAAKGQLTKVILETSLLSMDEIAEVCRSPRRPEQTLSKPAPAFPRAGRK